MEPQKRTRQVAPSLDEVSSLLRSWAASKPEILNAWLYGSRVRGRNREGGDVRPESDWDVAVELRGTSPDERRACWFRVIDLWNTEIETIVDWNVEVQLYNPPETARVADGVEECGVLVYSRNEGGNRKR